jgi:hypothetical protein
MLEVIKYCKYGHISPEDTIYVLRNPLLYQRPLFYDSKFNKEIDDSDIFIIEVSSVKTYEYKNMSCHHSVYTESERFKINETIKNSIILRQQNYDELCKDILDIKCLLNNKPIIIVTHISTIYEGGRYELIQMLEKICNENSIPILNPFKEITKRGYDIKYLLQDENHYNNTGHIVIKEIYDEFISKTLAS